MTKPSHTHTAHTPFPALPWTPLARRDSLPIHHRNMAAAAARAPDTPPTPSPLPPPPPPPPPAPAPPPQQPVGPRTRARTRAEMRREVLLAGRDRVAAAIAAGAVTTAANPIPARRRVKRVDWGIKVFRDPK
ncbi:hypothetical protein EDC01DRAFT_775708 [Geopyxis carbonaria]|nr:hypothetical protein EDC01DRAFT_775708 [Geopyxis carbonaria]